MDERGQAKPERVIPAPFMVLSFLNTGFFLVIYVFGCMAMIALRNIPYEAFEEVVQERYRAMGLSDAGPMMTEMIGIIHASGFALMLILALRTAMRLRGLVLMWQGRKAGFHLYAFAQMAGIFAPHLVLPLGYMGITGPLAAVGMTALYGMYVKHLPR